MVRSCRREAPLLERAYRRDGGRALFLGVNQNDARDDAPALDDDLARYNR